MTRYIIITHTDIDGVAASALYVYLQKGNCERTIYTEPYLLDKVISEIRGFRNIDKIIFMDLGLNKNIYEKIVNLLSELIKKDISIEWYDHHVWDEEWINKFREIGVKIHIDRSTCGVGVIAKYAPRRSDLDELFINELVNSVCSADLFRFDHKLGPWFYRLVRRIDSNEWRNYVFDKLSSGILWCDEFRDNVVERFEKEIEEYSNVDKYIEINTISNLRIGFILNNEYLESSLLASYALSRYSLDVAIVSSIDGKLSIRSRRYNIRELAYKLGGGGHPRAAGAKIKIPFTIRLKSLVNKQIVLKYVSEAVAKAINELGGLSKLE